MLAVLGWCGNLLAVEGDPSKTRGAGDEREMENMTITKYADGRRVENSSREDALTDIREEFPDYVSHCDGERTLIWSDEASAENDDGKNAVAALTVE